MKNKLKNYIEWVESCGSSSKNCGDIGNILCIIEMFV